MKTVLLTLSLCFLNAYVSFSQSREDTEKWIIETLQANAQVYKARQGFSDNVNKGSIVFLTYSDFSFGFEDGLFVIRCKMTYPKYMGADAVDKVVMRLPVYDIKIAEDADYKIANETYNLSFKTASAAFQYVNETASYKEEKWMFNIRVPYINNESLPEKLKNAFARLKQEYGRP